MLGIRLISSSTLYNVYAEGVRLEVKVIISISVCTKHTVSASDKIPQIYHLVRTSAISFLAYFSKCLRHENPAK